MSIIKYFSICVRKFSIFAAFELLKFHSLPLKSKHWNLHLKIKPEFFADVERISGESLHFDNQVVPGLVGNDDDADVEDDAFPTDDDDDDDDDHLWLQTLQLR